MTMQFLPVSHSLRDHVEACQRLAWFMVEAIERENVITFKALLATLPAPGWPWVQNPPVTRPQAAR